MTAPRERVSVIERLGALDRVADPALQGLARVAAAVAGSNFAAIHVLDDRFQRRLAGHDIDLLDHPVEDAMCTLVVESGEAIVTADATLDDRFSYSSFVAGDNPVKFYASMPLRVETGATFGTVCVFDQVSLDLQARQIALLEDIASQVSVHLELLTTVEDLARAASHDHLTGVANRLILGERLAHGLARQLRRKERLVVAMVDLDGFKAVNDTYGHATGDRLLREVARRLTSVVRPEDLVARTGGDEFVVVSILDQHDVSLETLAERLQAAIAKPMDLELDLDLDGNLPPSVTATVGITQAERYDSVATLLERADANMYARKGGRYDDPLAKLRASG